MDAHQEALVAEFAQVIAAPERLSGLTRQESLLVQAVQAGGGRPMPWGFLGDVIATDPMNPPSARTVQVVLRHARQKRPDLGRRIGVIRGDGPCWTAEAAE